MLLIAVSAIVVVIFLFVSFPVVLLLLLLPLLLLSFFIFFFFLFFSFFSFSSFLFISILFLFSLSTAVDDDIVERSKDQRYRHRHRFHLGCRRGGKCLRLGQERTRAAHRGTFIENGAIDFHLRLYHFCRDGETRQEMQRQDPRQEAEEERHRVSSVQYQVSEHGRNCLCIAYSSFFD